MFSAEEKESRYRAVRQVLDSDDLQVIILVGDAGVGTGIYGDLRYLTDYPVFYYRQVLVVFPDSEPVLFMDSGEVSYGFASGDRDTVEVELARGETCGSVYTKYTLEQIVKNLSHELIHCKQFIRGELSECGRVWKNVDHDDTPYEDQPWEIEAHELEQILFDKYWKL